MVIITTTTVRLTRVQMLGGLHPVQVEHSGVSKEGKGQVNDDISTNSLLGDLPEEVRPKIGCRCGNCC